MHMVLLNNYKRTFIYLLILAAFARIHGDLALSDWLLMGDKMEVFSYEIEDITKQSEKNEGKSFQELWLHPFFQTSLKISIDNTMLPNASSIDHILHSFYPAVPTPPPDVNI